MSIENVKKLELGMDKSCNCEKFVPAEQLTPEIVQQLINEGIRLEEEAFATKDIDVLNRAFDYFLEESDDNGLGNGVCETLINDIFNNFSVEQIIPVLYKKLNQLVELNMDKAVYMVGCCFDDIQELKKLVETLPPQKADELLERLENWYNEPFSNEVTILRKDMGTWPKK